MAKLKIEVILYLALLVSSAEASGYDPIVCYVLDAILLIYCIVFTALYFKLKLSRTKSGYSTQSSAACEAPQQESHYEALTAATNDDYQEIKSKSQPQKKRNKSKEGRKTTTAEGTAMIPVPPVPSRK